MCYRPNDSWNGEHITHKLGRRDTHDVGVRTGCEIDDHFVDTDALDGPDFNLSMNSGVSPCRRFQVDECVRQRSLTPAICSHSGVITPVVSVLT
jgi:hypothetical protein